MSEQRKIVRQTMATELATHLGTLVQEVSAYQNPDIHESPMVRIMSSGSQRPRVLSRGERSKLSFTIQTWVLATHMPGRGWTAEDAEDAIDEIEYSISQWISDNQNRPGLWTHIAYEGMSRVQPVITEDEVWLIENITIIVDSHS